VLLIAPLHIFGISLKLFWQHYNSRKYSDFINNDWVTCKKKRLRKEREGKKEWKIGYK
jgi:hypothetical protein